MQSLTCADLVSDEYHDDHCVILHLTTGLLPPYGQVSADCHEPVLFIDGEIFEIDGRPVRSEMVSKQLLERFKQNPSTFMNQVNGEFTVLVYEPKFHRLTILSDHLSSQSLFYYRLGDTFYFGSEKKAILALLPNLPALDEVGLLQLFANVHNFGDRTFIDGLKRQPPGSRLVVQGGKFSIDHWHSLHFGVQNVQSFDEVVEQSVAELRGAVTRRLHTKPKVVLSLSGGLDSRAITCAFPRDLRPLTAVTQGMEASKEVQVARDLAQRLSIEHVRLDPTRVPLSQLAPLVAWRTEGEIGLRGGLGSAYHAEIKQHGDFIAGGWFGECVSGNFIHPAMLLPRSETAFIDWCYSHSFIYNWATLGRVFSGEFLLRNKAAHRDSYHASWQQTDGPTLIDRSQEWTVWNRAVRMTNGSMPVDSHRFEKFRPFYDRRWIETMAGVPWRFKFGKAFYKAMIHGLGPEVRDVPDSTFGHLLHGHRWKNIGNHVEQLRSRALGRLRRRLVRSTALNVPAEGLFDPAALVRQDPNLRAAIQQFLQGPACDERVFNVKGIESLLKEHFEGGVDHSTLILHLATIHLALDYFVYQRPTSMPNNISCSTT